MPAFERACAPNEYLYHQLQAVDDPVCMQFLIEGDGAVDPARFAEAVARATAAAPGATLRLRGRRLVAGDAPVPVRFEPDAPAGDLDALPRLRAKLDVTQGPGAEVVVLGRDHPRLLFRVFHGVMDGKGALIWIENVFRALRGEPLIEARAALTDVAFLDARPDRTREAPVPLVPRYRVKPHAPWALGPVSWQRFRLAGRHPALLAQVAARLAAAASDDVSRFMLPVDMRRHEPDLACTANLTLPIFLDVPRGTPWRDVNGELIAQLMAGAELNRAAADFPAVFAVPPAALRLAIAGALAGLRLSGHFAASAILSHLGRLDLAAYSGGGFEARAFCSLPVHVPFAPLALVVVETPGQVDAVFSARRGLFSRAELAALLPEGAA